MKHLQYFLDMVNDSTITAKYATFIQSQGSAVVRYATGLYFSINYTVHGHFLGSRSIVLHVGPGYRVGSVWYGREVNVWGSRFTPQAQTSGLAALNAAIKAGLYFVSYLFKDARSYFEFVQFAAGGPC